MVTFKSSRPRFRFRTYRWTYRCTAKEEDRLIKSLIILPFLPDRTLNFRPWLERATVRQNTWENNDLTKERVSTSSSLPVDCLTNLTQPPTLRSNFQQNGARREQRKRILRVVGRKKKRERKREENKREKRGGKKMAKSVRSRGSFSVTRASRWNGEQEKPQDRCGGREGLSRPISLSIGSPFAVLAIQKIPDPQLHKCVAWAFELQWKSIGFIRPGKRLPTPFRLSLSFSFSLCCSALGVRSNVPPVNRGHPLNDQSEACNYVSEATWMCVLRGNICRDVRLNFKFHFYVPI